MNGKERPRLTANRRHQEAFLSLLRELRVQAGIRQVDMARALGKPQAFVSYYESGARRLDLLELREVCKILGVSLPPSSEGSRSSFNRASDRDGAGLGLALALRFPCSDCLCGSLFALSSGHVLGGFLASKRTALPTALRALLPEERQNGGRELRF